MNDNLQKYLDDELPLDALTPDERAEAAVWHELLKEADELRAVSAPPWVETRVMATLPAEPHRGWWSAARDWLTSPQPLSVRPLTIGMAATAFILFLVLGQHLDVKTLNDGEQATPDLHNVSNVASPVIYVQFVLVDKSAQTVTVAGDFNAWDTSSTALTDTNADGVWTGLVALRPGMHKYMFVIDGQKWVTDPEAERYLDDDFGMRNAVITVTPPARSI